MPKLPYYQRRSDNNTSPAMKRYITKYDYLCSVFSLVTSFVVYGASLMVLSLMVYYNYSVKWTFLGYVVSSGWLFVMNVFSNVLMISARRAEGRRDNRRTSRQTSINLELLNRVDDTRYTSRTAPTGALQGTNRTRLSECGTRHTPPPSYEDVSKISNEENNDESFSSGEATPQRTSLSNEKAVYDVLESAEELMKVGEVLRDEYGQMSEKYAQKKRYSPDSLKSSQRRLDKERSMQNLGDENAKRILHKRIEDRRNQLDRRLDGDSLKKMNEYCMRDLKREADFEKRSQDDGYLTPKESLRRNLKAKYCSSAENFRNIPSRDSVTSVYHSRNNIIGNFELPRVHHAKSTQSLRLPDVVSGPSAKSHSSGIDNCGLSLPEVHRRGSQPDIRKANDVGLPLERTWKQKPVKLPDRRKTDLDTAFSLKNLDDRRKTDLDTSFSLKHLDDRKRHDGNQCGRSKSMPGKQTSREREYGHV